MVDQSELKVPCGQEQTVALKGLPFSIEIEALQNSTLAKGKRNSTPQTWTRWCCYLSKDLKHRIRSTFEIFDAPPILIHLTDYQQRQFLLGIR